MDSNPDPNAAIRAPTVEDVAEAIRAVGHPRGIRDCARAVIALYAPVLAALESAKAETEQAKGMVEDLLRVVDVWQPRAESAEAALAAVGEAARAFIAEQDALDQARPLFTSAQLAGVKQRYENLKRAVAKVGA